MKPQKPKKYKKYKNKTQIFPKTQKLKKRKGPRET
jgi:hypothetical protein